uniref:Uncharacterized protein n=1 Tax=Anguilla anguilla TaxID=7936 RepID=A0A0E9Q7Q5_ANGAN
MLSYRISIHTLKHKHR